MMSLTSDCEYPSFLKVVTNLGFRPDGFGDACPGCHFVKCAVLGLGFIGWLLFGCFPTASTVFGLPIVGFYRWLVQRIATTYEG